MAKNNKACVAYPEVKPGVPSELYKSLLKNKNLINDRRTVNYVYVQYAASDAPEKMDALGYTRDKNGQHKATDVMNFFDVKGMLYERSDIATQKKIAGVEDSLGALIPYSDGIEALDKALDYNQHSKGFYAEIYKNGDFYYIKINEKNIKSFQTVGELEQTKKSFDFIKHAFNAVEIDFDTLRKQYPFIYNVNRPLESIEYLENLSHTNNAFLSKNELGFLLSTLTGTEIDRLKTRYGDDINTIVDAIYNAYRTPGGGWTTAGEAALVNQALNKAKKFNNLDIDDVVSNIFNIQSAIFDTNENLKLADFANNLISDYNLNDTNVIEIGKKLQYLSQIAAKAVINENRRLKQLQKLGASLTEQKEASTKVMQILNEIDKKRYYAGLIKYLDTVAQDILDAKTSLKMISSTTSGSTDYNRIAADTWIQINDIYLQHIDILEALVQLDSKIIDEDINETDRASLKHLASDLSIELKKMKGDLDDLQYSTMLNIITNVFGNELPDGRYVTNLLEMIQNDASFLDRMFYSFGKCSNELVGVMGKITLDAQDARKKIQQEIQVRIDRADYKLKKSGIKNTDWMFEQNKSGIWNLLSPYDWDAYYKARAVARKGYKSSGLKGFALLEKMQQWEEDNTEEVVVSSSGRKERFPSSLYRDDEKLLELNDAQREYYYEILNIKGDVEDMFPEWARSLYRPPQVRREMLDANDIKDFFVSMKNNLKNVWVREDDFDFLSNATLPEDGYFTDGNYQDDVKKSIPVYYVKHVDQKELLTSDLSGAMNRLVQSAANYKCMNDVVNTILLMQDYIENMPIRTKIAGRNSTEVLANAQTSIYQKIFHKGTNLQALMDGFIDMHYYGVKLKDKNNALTKLGKGLLKYTSVRGLSTNFLGGTSNFLVGEAQILIEACGGRYFGLKSYAKAQGIMFGYGTAGKIGEFMDFMTNNNNSLATLIGNRFDPNQEAHQNYADKRYYNGFMRHLLSVDPTFKVYSLGENLIHYAVMYAVLCEEKVLDKDGKKIDLYDAFEKSEEIDGSRTLKLKEGITTLNGEPLIDINCDYLSEVADKIKKANQDCHGAMNQEDKGLISQRMWGRFLIQMRQWMVEHYSRRFRGLHYDATEDGWTEGWWCTALKFLAQYDTDMNRLSRSARLKRVTLKNIIDEYNKECNNRTLEDDAFKSLEQKAKLAKNQLANINKFWADMALTSILCTLSWGILPAPKDLDEEFWTRFLSYQVRRLAWDQFQSTPFGVITNIYGIVKSPIPAASTMSGLLYPVWGLCLGDNFKTLQNGPNKGENKYWRNIKKYTFPIYKDIENLLRLHSDEGLFMPFDPNYALTR